MLPRGFLIEADEVAGWIEEAGNPGGTTWRVVVGRIDNDATVGGNLSQGGINVVDPNVSQKTGFARDFSAINPRTAYVSSGVIEARMRCVSVPDIPAEYSLVKGSGLGHIHCRDLEVTQARTT